MVKPNSWCLFLCGVNMVGKSTCAKQLGLPYLELDKFNRNRSWAYEKVATFAKEHDLIIADFHFRKKGLELLSLYYEYVLPIYIQISDEEYLKRVELRKGKVDFSKYLKRKQYKDTAAKNKYSFFISTQEDLKKIALMVEDQKRQLS